MIIPALLIAALAIVAYEVGSNKNQKLRIRGPTRALPGPNANRFRWNPRGFWERPGPGQPTYLEMLPQVLASGKTPTGPLLESAYMEAQRLRDVQAMGLIEYLYMQLSSPQVGAAQAAPQEQSSDVPPSEEEYEDVSARPAQAGPSVPAGASASPPGPVTCPIPDVETANWLSFLDALRTREPGYRSDNYLGSYEHNRRRLRQLGFDEGQLATADGQYRALCKDLADYHAQCKKLIDDYTGDVVDVPGKGQVPVTLSGVLGLLKAAGPKGAEGWLTQVGDRTQFPETTKVFIRCNGCF